MSLSDVSRRVPPPAQPVGAGSAPEWRAAEAKLGLELPVDYKQLVSTYGLGRFADFLTIFTPFADNEYVNLLAQPELSLEAYRALRAGHPDVAPYPAYPEPGGLLSWAQSDNGDVIYWLTEGSADTWPIVLIESRHGMIERYDVPTTDFLAQVLDGRLPTRILPRDLNEDASFTSL